MTVLHVDLNSFFARAEQQANSTFRDRPIGVLGKGHKGARTCVVAASPEAKHWGVKSGMSVAEAEQRCPAIRLVAPNYARYLDISRRFITILDRFSPWVEIFSIDEAFIALQRNNSEVRITNNELGSINPKGATKPLEFIQHFEQTLPEAISIAKNIKHALARELGELITCSIGIAWGKIFAKLAGELKKPDGLTVLSPDTWLETVGQLPVSELCGIGYQLTNSLNTLGVRTIEDLAHTDAGTLAARFGPSAGIRLWEIGQGIDRAPVAPHTKLGMAKSIGHQITLDRVARVDSLWPTITKLTTKVGRRMRRSGLWAGALSLDISLTSGSRLKGTLRLSEAAGEQALLTASQQLFNQLIPNRHWAIRVGIVAHQLGNSTATQILPCFPEEQRQQQITHALDTLRDHYGEDVIGWGSAHHIHLGNLRDWRGPRAVLDQ